MKLSSAQIAQVEDQLGADPIPEDHPAVGQLKETFGDHTFYVHPDGLVILQRADRSNSGKQAASLVKLASWTSEERDSLAVHEPERTDVVVTFDPEPPDRTD